ncbi:prenyltransferase/squalene oxidase repeat-containing protein [Streptomyces sp. NPDC006798]|uniref:prenyltransferase/squalene oxidase repeat-containing protein n=1 Tax=Streptomyces sp. NPDC006798 TaxID=3155462 RepID=UPI00340E693E
MGTYRRTEQRADRWWRTGRRTRGAVPGAVRAAVLRGVSGFAALLLLGSGTAYAAAPPAAAGTPEACTSVKGAVVAVDFGAFGGSVVRGCDTTPTTGYELLKAGGFRTTGTGHDGDAFICRIGHTSAPDGKAYPTPDREKCVDTPSADAYWSYWVAARGAKDWRYSDLGAMGRKPRPGDVDAWVFGATEIGGAGGKPSFTPDQVRAGIGPDEIRTRAAGAWARGLLVNGERVEISPGTPSPLHTTEAAYTIAATVGTGSALDRVTAYLRAGTTAYAYPRGGDEAPDPEAAARLALLAKITGKDPADFGGHDLTGDLRAAVCPAPVPGSPRPGCRTEGDFRHAASTEAQALAVLALVRAGATPPEAAVARLTRLECADGGHGSLLHPPGKRCDGEPRATALIALALEAAGGFDGALAETVGHLRDQQRPDGSLPGYTGGTGAADVGTTALAAQALRATGDGARADKAVAWLARQQFPLGGFSSDENALEPHLFPTSAAALAGTDTDLGSLVAKVIPADPEEPGPGGPGGPGEPGEDDGKRPDLKKGVAYLTHSDRLLRGRYYAVPGTRRADFGLTIDGAFALAATGHDDNKLRGVVDFLDQGGRDGEGRTLHDWTRAGTDRPSGGSIGKAALLAQVVGRDPRKFGGRDLIAELGQAVCPAAAEADGCVAAGNYRNAKSVFGQSLGVVAQVRAGEREAAAKPAGYLLSLQKDSGAWPSVLPATDPNDQDVDSTAMAAMALDLVGGPEADAAVERALTWLAGRQFADGGFPGAAGNSVNSAALAVQGLSLDAPAHRAKIAKAREFLAERQNPDGGFTINKGGQPGSDVRASTQAVGGSTGISFAVLKRGLSGTSPQPDPGPGPDGKPPVIVTPGDSSGGSAGGSGVSGGTGVTGGGGRLASTGTDALTVAGIAVALLVAGAGAVVVVRRRGAGRRR